MGNFGEILIQWWNRQGKILSFRILVFILFFSVAARQYGPFQQYLPEEKFLLLLVGPLLLLMLEILLDAKSGGEANMPRLVLSGEIMNDLRRMIIRGRTLDIAGSSTESIFLALRDDFVTTKRLHCRILLRNPAKDDIAQYEKLRRYADLWKSFEELNPNLHVEVKFSNNTVVRLFILDRTEVFLGFYKWDGKKYWGHSVPMINATPTTDFGKYVIDIANDVFEGLWDHSLPTMTYRDTV